MEVVVGDVYDVDVTRTWEFNSTAPIRSMVLPTILFGSPLYALKVRNTAGTVYKVHVCPTGNLPYI